MSSMPLTQRRWTRPLPGAPVAGGPIRVRVRDLVSPVPRRDVEPPTDASDRPTELHTVVAAANAAARRLGIDSSSPPWLAPLPAVVSAPDLGAVTTGADTTAGPGGVPLGLVDVPAEQRREIFRWRQEERGHLGIAGGPRSGRSTALVTLAVGLAESAVARDVHVHVLQGPPGPCAALARLPYVGTVTDSGNPMLSRRLLLRLLRLVDGDEVEPAQTVVLV